MTRHAPALLCSCCTSLTEVGPNKACSPSHLPCSGQDGVAAERLPTEHAPLQPLPPQHLELDDAVLPLDTAAAAGEVQQALPPRRSQQHAPVQLVQQQLTTHLAGRVASGAGEARQAVPRQQRPRVPGQGLPRQPAGGSGGFGSYWDAGPDEDDAFQEAWPASAQQGGGSRRAAGAGASAGQPGAGAAPRHRRRRQGGGSGGAAERMYRGGRREDELPDGGMDLLGATDSDVMGLEGVGQSWQQHACHRWVQASWKLHTCVAGTSTVRHATGADCFVCCPCYAIHTGCTCVPPLPPTFRLPGRVRLQPGRV